MKNYRDSYIFYRSFYDAIKELPSEDQLKIYQAIQIYQFEDIEPHLTGVLNAIWVLIRPQLDANNKRKRDGEKGKKYGRLGGRPTENKTPVGLLEKTPMGLQPETPNDNVNENDNVNNNKSTSMFFDEFWDIYIPVKNKDGHSIPKGHRGTCEKKFNGIVKDGVSKDVILDGLKKYLSHCKRNSIQTCGAEVFLNQRRWEVDYGEQRKSLLERLSENESAK